MSARPEGAQSGRNEPSRQHQQRRGNGAASKADVTLAEETVFRRVRGILNKLTVEKFDSLVDQLLHVGITSENVLKGIIFLLFEKALDEPTFSSLYAQVCLTLSREAPNFEPPSKGHDRRRRATTFTRLLLSKCKDEFENRSRACQLANERTPPAPGVDPTSLEHRRIELAEQAEIGLARRKMLGNIKFIGELGKLGLLSEKILHDCIKQLLSKIVDAVPEDVECLCRLLRTVGRQLDHEKARAHMDAYFVRLQMLTQPEAGLEQRVRFMVDDIVALRTTRWIPRRAQQDSGPKTINEIRMDALREQVAKSSGRKKQAAQAAAMRLMQQQQQQQMQAMSQEAGYALGPSVQRDRGVPSQPGEFQGMTRQDPLLPVDTHVHHGDKRSDQRDHHQRGHGGRDHRPRGLRQVPADQVSLRPGSILAPAGRPRAQQHQATQPPFQAGHARPAQPVAPVKRDNKQKKKGKPSKQELAQMTQSMLEEFFSVVDFDEAAKCVKELRTRSYNPVIVKQAIAMSADSKPEAQVNASALFKRLVNEDGLFTAADVEQGLEFVLGEIEDIQIDIPKISDILGGFVARAVADDVLRLKSVVNCFATGTYTAVFMKGIFQLKGLIGDDSLVQMYKGSEVDLTRVLPRDERNLNTLMAAVRKHGLGCLFPMLAVEDRLSDELVKLLPDAAAAAAADADSFGATFGEFVKGAFSEELNGGGAFLPVLAKSVFKRLHTLGQADGGDEAITKAGKQAEKTAFELLAPVLQSRAGDVTRKQADVLYALQLYCFESNFPKGLMLRMSVHLYDMDVVEEEAFMTWREELREDIPGKGEALIAVNEYLNWMKTAEAESEESEDETIPI